MKMTELYDAIDKIYVPGAIEHFAKQKPDRWQQLNDWLEAKIMNAESTDDLFDVYNDYYFGIQELIEEYKISLNKATEAKPHDAFFVGQDGVNAYNSMQKNVCYRCQNESDQLSLTFIQNGQTALLCHACNK